MMVSIFSSIRSRIFLLILIVAIPTFILIYYSGIEYRRLISSEVTRGAVNISQLVAEQFEQSLWMTQNLLMSLAQVPAVKTENEPVLGKILAAFLEKNSFCTNIGVMEPNGNLVSSAVKLSDQVNISTQKYFQQILSTRNFTIGNYRIDSTNNLAGVNLAYPILNENAKVLRVIFATLNISSLSKVIDNIDLPPASSLTIVDSKGIIIFRYPNLEKWIGQQAGEAAVVKTILTENKEGNVEIQGLDGIIKIFAFTPLSRDYTDGTQHLYLFTGIPKNVIYTDTFSVLKKIISIQFLIIAITLVIAYIGGYLFILKRTNSLIHTMQAMQSGDLNIRSGIPYSAGELGFLAQSFDHMLDNIQQHELDEEKFLKTLQESEERFRLLVERVKDYAIFMLDPHGYVISWNSGAERISGYETMEIIGRHFSCFYPPEDVNKSKPDTGLKIAAVHGVFEEEGLRLRKNGSVFWANVNITTIRDDEGKLKGFSNITRDITERKNAEKRIRNANRLYAVLSQVNQTIVHVHTQSQLFNDICNIAIEHGSFIMACVGLINHKNNIVNIEIYNGTNEDFVTEAKALLAGNIDEKYPTGRVIGENKYFICNDIMLDPLMHHWQKITSICGYFSLASFPLYVREHVIGTFNIFAGEPDFFNHEEIKLLSEMVTDICFALEIFEQEKQKKQAEEELWKTKANLEAVFQASPIGIIALNRELKVTMWNLAAQKILGRNKNEILNQFMPIVPLDSIEEFQKLIRTVLNGESVSDIELQSQRKDGLLLQISLSATPLRNTTGHITGIMAAFVDITERTKLEAQLRHAQKMEAIGTFAGGIAHDFNNILTAIVGHTTLLNMKMKKNDPAAIHTKQILIAVNRAAGMVRSLLTLSRKQISELKSVNLNDIVNKLHELFVSIIREDIEVKIILAQENITIIADRQQIEQVIMNFASNAIDAMPKGGQIIIKTATTEIDQQFIKMHGYGKIGRYAILSFSDTGLGMDDVTKRKIFEPFFTTKEVGKGTGLGLAIAYSIIKQHNGYITCYSEIDKGTTFRIYLPVTHNLPKEDKFPMLIEMPHGTETILFAEDDEQSREISKEVLESYGYKIIEAINGDDALIKFEMYRKKIKLIILDSIMPKKNGREVFEEIKKIQPESKILFISGYPAEIFSDLTEHKIQILLKPIRPKDLLLKIREILDK
jgi:PAS domain S-box-containing protein